MFTGCKYLMLRTVNKIKLFFSNFFLRNLFEAAKFIHIKCGRKVNGSLEESEFLILDILLLKKVANQSARPILDS